MNGVGPGTGSREGSRVAPGANGGTPASLQGDARQSPAQSTPGAVTNPVASPSELTIPATDVARGHPRTIEIEIDTKMIGVHATSAKGTIEKIVQDSLSKVRSALKSLEPSTETPVITISGLAGLDRQKADCCSSEVIATRYLEDDFLRELQAALLNYHITANVDLDLNAFPDPESGDQFLLRQEVQRDPFSYDIERDPFSYDINGGSYEKSKLVIFAKKVPASDTQPQTSLGLIAWLKSFFS